MAIAEKSLQVDNLNWFYREIEPESESKYPPVLFLHGLPSQSFTWCEIMPDLAQKGFRAIAPDWIGSGFSAKPDKRNFPYTPEAFLKALDSFLSALELQKISLVVQGFLGSLGILYALRHPEKIERLVIINTPLTAATKLPWQMRQWGLPFIGDMLTQDPLLVDRTLEGGSGYQISDQNLDVYRRPFLSSSDVGRALVTTIKNLQKSDSLAAIESGLREWSKSTLIIWGMEDPWLLNENAEKLASSAGNFELIRLKEAKHYPQEHFPEEISAFLSQFLRRST